MRKYGAKASFWEKDIFLPTYDYVIVGSGIVGLCSAIFLAKSKPIAKILILERGSIPTGASTRNAGFSCFGSASEILDDLKNINENEVKRTIQLRWEGLAILKEIVALEYMDYQNNGGFEYFINENNIEKCLGQLSWLNDFVEDAIGLKDTFSEETNHFNPKSQYPLLYNKFEGQLHPGKMMQQLIKIARNLNVQIEINSEVETVEDSENEVIICLKNKEIRKTKKVILATNAFVKQLINIEDCQAVRNQVYVTSRLKSNPLRGSYHHDKGYIYFRNIEDRILIGGARNKSEHEGVGHFGLSHEIENYLKQFLKNHVLLDQDDISFEYSWSGILGVGQSKSPIIEYVSTNIIAAVRLGGMGIAIGAMVGKNAAKLAIS